MAQLNNAIAMLRKEMEELKNKGGNLKKLKNLVKKLQQMLMDHLGQVCGYGTDEDVMFAKKPLQGWSCASCDKDIMNMAARQAEYSPWCKMPYRDPQERMAKVGQGFNNIAQHMKVEPLTPYRKSFGYSVGRDADFHGTTDYDKPKSASTGKRKVNKQMTVNKQSVAGGSSQPDLHSTEGSRGKKPSSKTGQEGIGSSTIEEEDLEEVPKRTHVRVRPMSSKITNISTRGSHF